MTPADEKNDRTTAGTPGGTGNPAEPEAPQPAPNYAERIIGENDPDDMDGLVTLDDLPDRTGDASDLGSLTRKASEYGDGSAG